MDGTIVNERPVDPIVVGVSGGVSARREGLEGPPPGSEESCSSCGARFEHDASRCPWCGRAVLKDAVFERTSIVLEFPASTESLRFLETGEGPSDTSHWSALDRISRSTGR